MKKIARKKFGPFLDLCVSSLRRGHANLLCIVPILSDVSEETEAGIANTVYIDLHSFSANNMGYNGLLSTVRFPTARGSELKRLSNAAELWSFFASRLPQLLLFVAMLPEKLRFGAIYGMKRGSLSGDLKTRWASRNSCQRRPILLFKNTGILLKFFLSATIDTDDQQMMLSLLHFVSILFLLLNLHDESKVL